MWRRVHSIKNTSLRNIVTCEIKSLEREIKSAFGCFIRYDITLAPIAMCCCSGCVFTLRLPNICDWEGFWSAIMIIRLCYVTFGYELFCFMWLYLGLQQFIVCREVRIWFDVPRVFALAKTLNLVLHYHTSFVSFFQSSYKMSFFIFTAESAFPFELWCLGERA